MREVVAVADAGPIIHLGEIDSLELLSALDHLSVPETVCEEIHAGGAPSGFGSLSYERVSPDHTSVEEVDLDRGETAALTVATERDAVLLTDDLATRDAAGNVDVEAHGSLGVIALAHGRGQLERAEAIRQMRALQRETSLFVTDAVVERGIELLGNDE